MRIRRILRITALILIIGLLLGVALGIYIYAYGQTDRAAPSDVIIILGAGTRPDGSPSPAHLRRVRHGVALYQKGLAPLILCTGGYTENRPVSEARACADAAIRLGVPSTAILMEEKSRSTEENAIESQKVMQARGLKMALVVSDNFHLWRAEMLFGAQGMAVALSPAQLTSGPLAAWTVFTNTAREVAATGWYVFKTVLHLPITDLKF